VLTSGNHPVTGLKWTGIASYSKNLTRSHMGTLGTPGTIQEHNFHFDFINIITVLHYESYLIIILKRVLQPHQFISVYKVGICHFKSMDVVL